MQIYYTALDEMQYSLSDADFSQKWILLSWPDKIEKLVQKTEKILASDMERYQKEMEEQQSIFVITMENLEASVGAFSAHTDLELVVAPPHSLRFQALAYFYGSLT